MNSQATFEEALDLAERLDDAAQAELIAVLSRRFAEQGRQRVVETVAEARREFSAGDCEVMTAADIVRDAQS